MSKYETSDFPFLVQTPYGRGVVLRTRIIDNDNEDGNNQIMKEIRMMSPDNDGRDSSLQPSSNQNQQQQQQKEQQPLLYSTTNFPSVIPQIGDDVICTNFGRGRVVALRHDTHPHDNNTTTTMVQVEISYWKLAGRSKVMGWFALSHIRVVRRKSLQEMTLAWEKILHAQEMKQLASGKFASKQYGEALEYYVQAVDAVRFIQHDANSTNEVRADLVIVMITCCNNAALCCFQLLNNNTVDKDSTTTNNNKNSVLPQNNNRCDRGIQYSKNALVMIDALYGKRGLKIHSILTNSINGVTTDSKLFGEWKVKSLFLLGRFSVHQRKYEEAQQRLKQALAVISQYTSEEESSSQTTTPQSKKSLLSQDRQIRKLLMTILQKRKAEKKKEKQRAMAMFGGGGGGGTSAANKNNNKEATSKTNGTKSPHTASSKPSIAINPKQSTANGSSSTTTATSTPSPITPQQNQQPPLSAMKNHKNSVLSNTTASPISSRRVSFSDMDEVTEFDSTNEKGINSFTHTFHVDNDNNKGGGGEEDDNDKDKPAAWYQEHFEALLVTGVMVAIGAAAMTLLRSTTSKSRK